MEWQKLTVNWTHFPYCAWDTSCCIPCMGDGNPPLLRSHVWGVGTHPQGPYVWEGTQSPDMGPQKGWVPTPQTWDTTGYGQPTGGMHPTRMPSCLKFYFHILLLTKFPKFVLKFRCKQECIPVYPPLVFAFSKRRILIRKSSRVQANLVIWWSVVGLALKEPEDIM